MRIILAALLGGLIMFLYGALSHMVFQIGEADLKTLPDEVSSASAIGELTDADGMYFFPAMPKGKLSDAEREAWTKRYTEGPTGMLIISKQGRPAMSPKQLGGELISNILCAFLAAMFAAQLTGGILKRAIWIGALGFFAWTSVSFSYWNWYGFTDGFILGELVEQVTGWLLAGLGIAWLVKPRYTSTFR